MGVVELLKRQVWDDVYDVKLDDKVAPDLSDVARGEGDRIYIDAGEFFKRTYLTPSIKEVVKEVAHVLRGEREGGVFLLASLFGGGKTHTLITLYHAFTKPEALRELDLGLAEVVAQVGRPTIVVMDGTRGDSIPHPMEVYRVDGFEIKTIWGMLGYRLGNYAEVRDFDDRSRPAPSVTVIQSLLSKARKPLLILLDEIMPYVYNLSKSELKDYADNVILFLGYLAEAVSKTPGVALVVAIQAEPVKRGDKVVWEYEYRDVAERMLRLLKRISTREIVPVTSDDIVKVLRRRIFKEIPPDVAQKAKDLLYEKYREYRELFGEESDWGYTSESGSKVPVWDTYPFHPKYIEVLKTVVTRNLDLQKTRDALRITRKVVRRLLKSSENSTFIMPWHIDLRDRDIWKLVLTNRYAQFRDVVSRDIVDVDGKLGAVRECSKPDLAYKIAVSVFLKTYTYETFKEPLKVFPDLREVALAVYDPEALGFTPVDIKDMLAEMKNRLPHFTSADGRYWFTPYPSVMEYVERRAEELYRLSRLDLCKVVKDRIEKEALVARESSKKEADGGKIFKRNNVVVVGCEDYDEDVRKMRDVPQPWLVVLFKEHVDVEEIRKIMFNVGGSSRMYKNAVVVVTPRESVEYGDCKKVSRGDVDRLYRYAAKLKAAEEIKKNLKEYYTDRDIVKLQEGKLDDIIKETSEQLRERILTVLSFVFYPDKVKGREEVRCVVADRGTSLTSQVEEALRKGSTGPKLRDSLTFGELKDFLRENLGWDLAEGSKRVSFSEIVEKFYILTSAPLTTREAIEEAIIGGVEGRSIGVLAEGELYWRKVESVDELRGRAELQHVGDNAEILPYRDAARYVIDVLLEKSGVERRGGRVREVWYEVEYMGRAIKLADLVNQKDWEKVLREGTISRREREYEEGFMVSLKPSYVSVRAGDVVRVNVVVKPIESYDRPIRLEVDVGTVSPGEGVGEFTALWEVGAVEGAGGRKFKIRAVGEDGVAREEILTVVVETPEVEIETDVLSRSHVGASLVEIRPKTLVATRTALDLVDKYKWDAKASLTVRFDNAEFKSGEIDVKLLNAVIRHLIEIERVFGMSTVECVVKLASPVKLDERLVAAFSSPSLRASFKLMSQES